MVWKTCQHCHGNKVIQQQQPNGTWKTITCPACRGAGGVDTKNL